MAFEGRYRETQRGGGFGGGATSAEPSENDTATALQELDRDLVTLKGCVEGIGTQFDDQENRKQIKRLRSVIKSKVTSAQGNLKSGKRSNPQSKIIIDRQSAQLDKQIGVFQNILEKEKTMIRQNPQPSALSPQDGGDSPEDNTRESVIAPSQAMSQAQRMGGLEEREREAEELQQLETDILDLRDIHQDMAGMVEEQGHDLDRIDKNVTVAAIRVESGTKQTKIAMVLKKKGTRLKLVIVAIITAVIIAILVILAILIGVLVPRSSQ